MTHEEHEKRHDELHKYLDELLADYITHGNGRSTHSIFDLLNWSYGQCIKLTHSSEEKNES
jgi:hypothetical protein